jgi:hypothetical protein
MIVLRNLWNLGKYVVINWFGLRYTHRLNFDLTEEMQQAIDTDVEPLCYCSLCVWIRTYCQFIVYPLGLIFIPLKLEKLV